MTRQLAVAVGLVLALLVLVAIIRKFRWPTTIIIKNVNLLSLSFLTVTVPSLAVVAAALLLWFWSGSDLGVGAKHTNAGEQIARQIANGKWIEGDMPAESMDAAVSVVLRFQKALKSSFHFHVGGLTLRGRSLEDYLRDPGTLDRTPAQREVRIERVGQKWTVKVSRQLWKSVADEITGPPLVTPDGKVAVVYRVGRKKRLVVDDTFVGEPNDEIFPNFRPCGDVHGKWCVIALVRDNDWCGVFDGQREWRNGIPGCQIGDRKLSEMDEEFATDQPRFLSESIASAELPLVVHRSDMLIQDGTTHEPKGGQFKWLMLTEEGVLTATVEGGGLTTLWIAGSQWSNWYEQMAVFAIGPRKIGSALVRINNSFTYVVDQRPLNETFAVGHVFTLNDDGKMIAAAVADAVGKWRVIVRSTEPGRKCKGVEIAVGHAERRCLGPGAGKREGFTDCSECPEMVVAPSGQFMMGSPADDVERLSEREQLVSVRITKPFAVGRFAITRKEYAAFVASTNHRPRNDCSGPGSGLSGVSWLSPGFAQNERHPVVCVSWNDAKAYVHWLSSKTGRPYRLLSETEREFVARAGSTTPFWWGHEVSPRQANYNGSTQATVPVQTFDPNPWGLYNVHGNVWDWTEDCWNESNLANPGDGSARASKDCGARTARGGSWFSYPRLLRSGYRHSFHPDFRANNIGFRVARTLEP